MEGFQTGVMQSHLHFQMITSMVSQNLNLDMNQNLERVKLAKYGEKSTSNEFSIHNKIMLIFYHFGFGFFERHKPYLSLTSPLFSSSEINTSF